MQPHHFDKFQKKGKYMNLTSMELTLFENESQQSPLKSAFKSNVCQEIVLTESDTNQSEKNKHSPDIQCIESGSITNLIMRMF